MVDLSFHNNAWDEVLWYAHNDRKLLSKVIELLESIRKNLLKE